MTAGDLIFPIVGLFASASVIPVALCRAAAMADERGRLIFSRTDGCAKGWSADGNGAELVGLNRFDVPSMPAGNPIEGAGSPACPSHSHLSGVEVGL